MLTSMGDILREAYRRNWITVRDGNISLRRSNKFYITPSGWRKDIIHPEHILRAFITNDGNLTWRDSTNYKPSGELRMHIMLQTTNFRGCRSVVHLHPTHVIACMEKGWNLSDIEDRLQELSRYTKVGPNVRKLPVTSDILAEETYRSMTKDGQLSYDIVGQLGHGVCSISDKSPWEAFHHIERLNHACEIMLLSGVSPK